jgi:hypothetical protein
MNMNAYMITKLIGVSDTGHSTHHTENVVVKGVNTDLSSGSSGNSRRRKDKLKNSVINSGKVA